MGYLNREEDGTCICLWIPVEPSIEYMPFLLKFPSVPPLDWFHGNVSHVRWCRRLMPLAFALPGNHLCFSTSHIRDDKFSHLTWDRTGAATNDVHVRKWEIIIGMCASFLGLACFCLSPFLSCWCLLPAANGKKTIKRIIGETHWAWINARKRVCAHWDCSAASSKGGGGESEEIECG